MRGSSTDHFRTILINSNQPNLNLKTAPRTILINPNPNQQKLNLKTYPKDYMSKITNLNTTHKTEHIQNKHDIK